MRRTGGGAVLDVAPDGTYNVDLEKKRIEQFVLNDGSKYDSAGEHDSSGDDEISARFVSGVTVDLTKVW